MTIFKSLWRSLAVARTCSALAALSDRQLADIGIERKDIFAHADEMYGG